MPSVAQWTGSPSIKGSSESMRMALLTASLVGLQYAATSSSFQTTRLTAL
jgi:hypothetical protein